MQVRLIKEFYFEAAHAVPGSGVKGERLHGHSFRVELFVEGITEPEMGWLIDFGDIRRAFRPLLDQLDHSVINEIEGMDDPSLDGIAAWIKMRLALEIPQLADVLVTVQGDNYFNPVVLAADPLRDLPARVKFTFEAAQSLPQLPEGHPCRRMHGHSYRVEIGAGNLEGLDKPIRALYDDLDHRSLNDIAGLKYATCEVICKWIWDRLAQEVDDLTAVAVQETTTARCIYYGK